MRVNSNKSQGNDSGRVGSEENSGFISVTDELNKLAHQGYIEGEERTCYVDLEGIKDKGLEAEVVEEQKKPKKAKLKRVGGKPKIGKGLFIYIILMCFILFLIVGVFYKKYITYPPKASIDYKTTEGYAMEQYQGMLHQMNFSGKDSYIAKEVLYANNNPEKIIFIKTILSSFSYSYEAEHVKNIYGNNYINPETKEYEFYSYPVMSTDTRFGVSYVDYSKIKVDESKVKAIMSDLELNPSCVDYSNLLVNAFCRYITELDSLPTTMVEHKPFVEKVKGGYEVSKKEDIFLDKLFFSSKEFYDLLNRFSEVAYNVSEKSGSKLEPTAEWVKWSVLSSKDKEKVEEPTKYFYKNAISNLWCGTYYLMEEHSVLDANGNRIKQKVNRELGDGTLKNPASYDTGIITSTMVQSVDESGNPLMIPMPIRVKLKDYGVSKDAIKWFEGKDPLNRGIDISSDIQYCYYTFEITNLSNRVLEIKDNSGLCDSNGNLSPRTGTIYGLKDTFTLKPDETGLIESWNRSTELNKKYVIWGSDFDKSTALVWFRLLQGDLEDSSENKGVYIRQD